MQAACRARVQSAMRLGNRYFMLDMTTWKRDLRTRFHFYLMANEIHGIKIHLKVKRVDLAGLYHLVFVIWRYLERKKIFYYDCKRNSLGLLWTLVIVLLVLDAKFPVPPWQSVPNSINKRLLFRCIMWVLLSGKDPESELPPGVSCLILQRHCQLEITVLTF